MCKFANTKNMSREEWLALRKNGIGGSDAGAICGMNPYASPMDVYLDKTSDSISDVDTEAMREGRDLEDYVAKRFCEATGFKVRRSNAMYVHPQFSWMLADVDRLIVGCTEKGGIGLECKTASPYNAEKWKDGAIPAHYLCQCYHYMAVLGADIWYIAVLIYGKEFKYIRIDRDEEIIQNLIEIESNFWNAHVLKRVLPEPDGSNATDSFVNQYFKANNELPAKPLIGFDEKLERRQELNDLLEKLEKEKKQIEQELKVYLGENELAENENFFISWKNTISNRVDSTRLKKELPEIYNQFCKSVQSRRLFIKSVA